MRLFRIDFSDTGLKRMTVRGSVTRFEQSVRNLGVVGLLSFLERRGLISFEVFGTTPAVGVPVPDLSMGVSKLVRAR